MKKIVSIVITFLLVLGLVACSSGEKTKKMKDYTPEYKAFFEGIKNDSKYKYIKTLNVEGEPVNVLCNMNVGDSFVVNSGWQKAGEIKWEITEMNVKYASDKDDKGNKLLLGFNVYLTVKHTVNNSDVKNPYGQFKATLNRVKTSGEYVEIDTDKEYDVKLSLDDSKEFILKPRLNKRLKEFDDENRTYYIELKQGLFN